VVCRFGHKAQLFWCRARASVNSYGSEGLGFESLRVHHFIHRNAVNALRVHGVLSCPGSGCIGVLRSPAGAFQTLLSLTVRPQGESGWLIEHHTHEAPLPSLAPPQRNGVLLSNMRSVSRTNLPVPPNPPPKESESARASLAGHAYFFDAVRDPCCMKVTTDQPQATIGQIIDDAMTGIERDNPSASAHSRGTFRIQTPGPVCLSVYIFSIMRQFRSEEID